MISQQIYHENKVHHIYLASTVSFSVLKQLSRYNYDTKF